MWNIHIYIVHVKILFANFADILNEVVCKYETLSPIRIDIIVLKCSQRFLTKYILTMV